MGQIIEYVNLLHAHGIDSTQAINFLARQNGDAEFSRRARVARLLMSSREALANALDATASASESLEGQSVDLVAVFKMLSRDEQDVLRSAVDGPISREEFDLSLFARSLQRLADKLNAATTNRTSLTLLERLTESGDNAAWQEFLSLYDGLIYGFLLSQNVRRQAAEDIHQDVMEVVVRKLPKFRHNRKVGAFRAWLRKITANCWLAYLRRHREAAGGGDEHHELINQLEDHTSRLSRIWDEQHNQHILRHVWKQLKQRFKDWELEAFERLKLRGEKLDTIAAELGKTKNHISVTVHRVFAALRKRTVSMADLLDQPDKTSAGDDP